MGFDVMEASIYLAWEDRRAYSQILLEIEQKELTEEGMG
jgi:hypothetical protein